MKYILKRYGHVFAVGLVGILFTWLAVNMTVSFEDKMFQKVFDQRAASHAGAVRQGMEAENNMAKLMLNQVAIALVHEESADMETYEFQKMAAEFHMQAPLFRDFIWIPANDLLNIQRIDIDYLNDKENFVLLEENSLLHASYAEGVRAEHERKEQVDVVQSLQKILKTRSGRETIAVEHDDHSTTLHMLPLFSDEQASDLRGVLILTWRLADAIESSVSFLPPAGMDIEVSHGARGTASHYAIYKHVSRTRSLSSEEIDSSRVYTSHTHFSLLGEKWFSDYKSAPAFIAAFPYAMAWQTILGGLLTTFLVCLILLLQMKRGVWIENLVTKRTEELAESEIRFEKMIEHMPVGIAIHKDGLIKYLNPFFLQVIGDAKLDDVVGDRVLKYVHPDDHEQVIEDAQRALDDGESVHNIPVRYMTPDGDRRVHEMLASRTSIVSGGETLSVTIALDMTEQNQMRRTLEIEHQRMQLILDHAPIGIWMLDKNLEITFENQAFLTSKLKSSGIIPDKTRFDKKEIRNNIERILDDEGNQHVFEIVRVPLYLGDEFQGIVGLSVDASERAQAESEKERTLKKAEAAQRLESLGVLAGGIAHDFNNLLTVILGNATLASADLHDKPEFAKYFQRIDEATTRAATLCNQMLAYAGKGKYLIRRLNMTNVVQEMSRLLEVSLVKNVTIEYELSDDIEDIDADTAQLQQVVMNLITNANESMQEKGGVIRMRTGKQLVNEPLKNIVSDGELEMGEYTYVEVKDQGCGMDKNTLAKIFEPFFTTKFTGRGLGMSAMLGTVKSHGGAIQVMSVVGKGTLFRILFPVAADDSDASDWAVETIFAGIEGEQSKKKVLLVDDEDIILETLEMMIKDLGYECLLAKNGLEALDLYREYQDDIGSVLMDMTMPKMGGKACLIELQKLNPTVKVIMLSGYTEDDISEQLQDVETAGFMQKPFNMTLLRKRVHRLMNS